MPPPPPPPMHSTAPGQSPHPQDAFGSMRYCHWRRLRDFYEHYAPDRVDRCHEVLDTYAGREGELFAALERRYGPEPTGPEPTGPEPTAAAVGRATRPAAALERIAVAHLSARGIPSRALAGRLAESCNGDAIVLRANLAHAAGPVVPMDVIEEMPAGFVAARLRAMGERLPLVANFTDTPGAPPNFWERRAGPSVTFIDQYDES